jgi:hypothetical protein
MLKQAVITNNFNGNSIIYLIDFAIIVVYGGGLYEIQNYCP